MECTSIFNLHVDIWIVISKYLCPSDWKNLISTRNRELIGKLKSLKLDIRLDDHSLISMRVMSWFINAQSWFAYHLPLHLPSMRLLKTIKIKNNIKGWNYEQLHCIPYHCRSLQTIIIKSCPIILTDEWFNALPPSITHLSIHQVTIPDFIPRYLPKKLKYLKMNVFSLLQIPDLPSTLNQLHIVAVFSCPNVIKILEEKIDSVNINPCYTPKRDCFKQKKNMITYRCLPDHQISRLTEGFMIQPSLME